MAEARKPQETPQESFALASLGLALSDWFERWFPDAFALALAAAAIVAAASMLSGSSALETAQRFGAGFWDLATFTLQMSLIIVTGYAVATAPPVYAMIRRLATLPSSGRGAVAFVALFSMLASLVSWSFSLIFSGLLAREVATAGPSIVLDLNHYLFLFLIVGLLLHWRPRSFVQAITASVTPVGGVLIQYPIYAGIVRVMTEGGLATTLAHFFVSISTQHTYPVMIGIYSAFLGLFIPSAGGKWLIEAPYMLDAAKSLQVHLGWVVQTYNATEALANLIHPFWMLPLLGILGIKARDIVGYSMLQFVVHVPLVLFLVWALNYTLTYVPPTF
jgi:short subunit fatty acids transporter